MNNRSILFISADPAAAAKVETALREGIDEGFAWNHKAALLDGLRSLQDGSYDLILSDLFLQEKRRQCCDNEGDHGETKRMSEKITVPAFAPWKS